MNPTLEIFSQGDEIVTGQIADTNAAWLAQQAVNLGFALTRHTAVGDCLTDLVTVLHEIAGRADCCLCTGGLGPTCDDLTAEAFAEAFTVPLVFDEIAFAQIEHRFSQRGKVMPALNRKQALLPQGAMRLENTCGTAPGFAMLQQRCWFVFMPGVPSEMQAMFSIVLPLLGSRFTLRPSHLVTFKTQGIGESALQERLNSLVIPADITLGFRASTHEVQVKLRFSYNCTETVKFAVIEQVKALLSDTVFAIEG